MGSHTELVGAYDFNDTAILVEMIVDEFPEKIDFGSFCVPEKSLKQSDWQVAYIEQYLNLDGTDKLCETYDIPAEQSKPSRVAFFLFKTEAQGLSTPYGGFSLVHIQELPDRLAKIVEFDGVD